MKRIINCIGCHRRKENYAKNMCRNCYTRHWMRGTCAYYKPPEFCDYCPNHAWRQMESRMCVFCFKQHMSFMQSLAYYGNGGYANWSEERKERNRKTHRAHYSNNKEYYKENVRNYYAKNINKVKKRHKEYYTKHRQERIEYQNKYNKARRIQRNL